MSNRFISILIMLLVFVGLFIYIVIFYIPNKQLESQIAEQETLIQYESQQITLSEVENKEESSTGETLSSFDKIQDIKDRMTSYKVLYIDNDKFIFVENENKLTLTLNGDFVGFFDLVAENQIIVDKIYGVSNEFFVNIGNKKFIYNNNIDNLFEINLAILIEYIKKSENFYLIKTEKGIFSLDKSNNLEYVDIFEDFVYYNDGYVGIIKGSDSRRVNNLGLDLITGNMIYYYNPQTKEKKSLYTTSLNLMKIYTTGAEIYFEEEGSGIYKLENF